MAHKKGVGSSKNGRESESKLLGVKIFGGQAAVAGCLFCVFICHDDSFILDTQSIFWLKGVIL